MINNLYKHNDQLFIIKREIAIHCFKKKGEGEVGREGEKFVKEWRDYLRADHVLRTQTHYLFCDRVEDIEVEWVKEEEL